MNPEVKKRWIEALPQYKQGTKVLRYNDEFCCLGVLCDLHAKETGNTWDYVPTTVEFKYLNATAHLPMEVVKWAGLHSESPECGGAFLTETNDLRVPFKDIAILIDRYL